MVELARGSREAGGARLDVAACPALPRVLGSSGFLARLLLRHPDWLAELAGALPEAPPARPIDADWDAIREAKYRGLLRITARDLLARPFESSLRELSDLADRCLAAALACAARETEVEAPALLALGKLGGRELNFSSDVDLLFVYESPAAVDPLEHNHAVARLIRRLKSALEAAQRGRLRLSRGPGPAPRGGYRRARQSDRGRAGLLRVASARSGSGRC